MRRGRATGWGIVAAALVLLFARPAAADEPPPLYVLVVDQSGSMKERPQGWPLSKMETVRERLAPFADAVPAGAEVEVVSFDHQVRPRGRLVIAGPADRARLRALFGELAFNPDGATHAWSTLDWVLGRARERAARVPGATARVFFYTDGEDTEGPEAARSERLRAVLAKYRDDLRGPVETTFLTLGFSFKQDVLAALEGGGMQVFSDVRPDDLLPVVADFEWTPRRPVRGQEVRFVETTKGAVTTWSWSVEGVGTSDAKSPAFTFPRAGTYAVTLRASGHRGRGHTVVRRVEVGDPEPLAVSIRVTPADLALGSPVQCVSEVRGAVRSYRWSFGDGTTSEEPHPAHVYAAPGTYSVSLTVTGDDGSTKSAEIRDAVRVTGPKAPVVDFVGPDAAAVGAALAFYDRTTGLVDTWAWDFGDRTPAASTRDATHVYAAEGTFRVTLTASGPGGTAQKSLDVRVAPPESPVAALAVGNEHPRVGDEVAFVDQSVGAVERATWTFGDGAAPVVVAYPDPRDPAPRTQRRRFDRPGPVRVRLEVAGRGGTQATERTVVVEDAESAPVAAFDVVVGAGRETRPVTLRNRSSGTWTRFEWTVRRRGGDVVAAVEATTLADVERSLAPGTYDVTLKAIGLPRFPPGERRDAFTVPEPPGYWEEHPVLLWGLVAAALALLAAAVLLVRARAIDRARSKARARASLLPAGTLQVRRAGAEDEPWEPVAVPGGDPVADVALPPAAATAFAGANVQLVAHPEGDPPRPVVHLRVGGGSEQRFDDASEPVQAHGFEFRFDRL